jgi:aryl-alcohol dehydrogenase-like predicted oxidoreductase
MLNSKQWTYDTPIQEVMHSLNDLVQSGKVLYLGISDTPAWIVSKANEYCCRNECQEK